MYNLKDRLKKIHELKKDDAGKKQPVYKNEKTINTHDLIVRGWEECASLVLKRNITLKKKYTINDKLPRAIEALLPDLSAFAAQGKPLPKLSDFLFFDLETTGLSGGAGTVAFLAAFGRFTGDERLLVTQYLLLDYPGENDFLEYVLEEINKNNPVIATYNGKCFDAQVLKTRFLMNGIKPPVYYHIDILHPARRLWKNIIYDCSQASVETKILSLDRTGDIPGSEAPDIWFEFLKTGKTERLLGICDHNIKDISGLAAMLLAVISIADDPLGQNEYQYDIQRLAFFWRSFLCRGKRYLLPQYKEMLETCYKILKNIVNSSYPDKIKFEAERFLKIYNNRWKKNKTFKQDA